LSTDNCYGLIKLDSRAADELELSRANQCQCRQDVAFRVITGIVAAVPVAGHQLL